MLCGAPAPVAEMSSATRGGEDVLPMTRYDGLTFVLSANSMAASGVIPGFLAGDVTYLMLDACTPACISVV
jgi:hypothetical protein